MITNKNTNHSHLRAPSGEEKKQNGKTYNQALGTNTPITNPFKASNTTWRIQTSVRQQIAHRNSAITVSRNITTTHRNGRACFQYSRTLLVYVKKINRKGRSQTDFLNFYCIGCWLRGNNQQGPTPKMRKGYGGTVASLLTSVKTAVEEAVAFASAIADAEVLGVLMAEVEAAAGIMSGVMLLKPVLWDPIREVSRDMGKIDGDLTNAMQKLLAKKECHEKMLMLWNSTKRPSTIYNNWIQEATKLEKDVEEIDAKYERKRNKSKLLHYFTCSKLCEKMKNMLEMAVRLEGTLVGDILVGKEPDHVVEMKGAPDIKKFPTLSVPLEKILGLLTKRKIKGIKILGMMGTGKTTIMQNLNNHEKIAAMFDLDYLVIWVNVSMEENKWNFSLEQMQQSIVKRLNLDVEGANDEKVAERIRGELWDKKCLLLLDGVKEDFELTQIGIALNYGNGSKLVLTTRMGHVYDSIVDQVVRVGRLSNDEARDMFKKILGQSKCNFGPVMSGVVKCCDNLPFVIKMVASAFKNKETEESWVQGYKNLTRFPKEGDVAIQKVYKYLEFCCDELEGAQKNCFLYCASYPEESDIGADWLLDCWAAEDLYGTNQVRDFGCHILDELKKVSLLEERVYGYVKMHKLIRKVALGKLLADCERKHLVKISQSVQDPLSVEDWNQKNRISLVDNKLTTLPECPDCPMLSTLILKRNQSLNKIHNLFFENTGNLRVLDLCHTGIASLPSSLRKLKLLKVLYLNDCTCLVQLPSEIGELESLQVLDIRGSGVDSVPLQNEGVLGTIRRPIQNLIFRNLKPGPCASLTNIEKLHNLKRLLVSFNNFGYENDAYISDYCNVISKVSTTLEELVIDVKSYKQRCGKMINMVRDKVAATMTKLTTLKFCFEDGVEDVIKVVADTPQTYYPLADDLKSFVEKIDDSASESFQLFIGCSISLHPQIPKRDQYGRYLKYCNGRGCNPTTIGEVVAITDAFELVNHNDLEHVSEFGIESLYGVQGCLIEACNSITEIVDGNCTKDGPLLPNLLRLYIKKLPKLGSIWKGPVHLWSLSKLRTLLIDDCSSIEELLIEPASVAVLPNLRKLVLLNLPNLTRICKNVSPKWPALEKLKIQNCPGLTVFPFCKDNTEKLRKLTLQGIPNLEMICASESFEWPALEKLKIYGCCSLTKLPFNKDNAKNLSSLEAEEKWWEALLWQDCTVKAWLQPYCSLRLIDQDAATNTANGGPKCGD
ncbi:hypothetical protein LguiA_026176 [Lonicera macranthoides]